MRGKFDKLSQLIVDEFQDHVDQISSHIKDDKDFENAVQEAIEVKIGQVHNIKIWRELAEVYTHMLHRKIGSSVEAPKANKGLTYADQVRRYCIDNIVDPARDRGEKQIAIRAGDIHSAMGFRSKMPLVCAALGAQKFEELAGVERIGLFGPSNGANAVFTFMLK
jgi:hypothetical protein